MSINNSRFDLSLQFCCYLGRYIWWLIKLMAYVKIFMEFLLDVVKLYTYILKYVLYIELYSPSCSWSYSICFQRNISVRRPLVGTPSAPSVIPSPPPPTAPRLWRPHRPDRPWWAAAALTASTISKSCARKRPVGLDMMMLDEVWCWRFER